MDPQGKSRYRIEAMTPETSRRATEVRLKSWLDTYVNDELGITREWIERRNTAQLTEEKHLARIDRLVNDKPKGIFNAWVALDESNEVIGVVTPLIESDGTQLIGSIYVDKSWHGTGVGGDLMRVAIDWFDSSKPIQLGVASYNERAKAFYRKWGFKEVPGSEELFDGLIPEVKMVRLGGSE